MSNLIIGVDEVGRGPLAGPITLAAFMAEGKLKNKLVKILGGKIKDSKQFSPERRNGIYRELLKLKKETCPNTKTNTKSWQVFFSVSHVSNKLIDKKGLTYATNIGIKKCLKKLQHESQTNKDDPCAFEKCGVIRLDGLLKAPKEYKNQKTIIGGDSKDVFIACASVVAKVRRDRLMRRLAKKFPQYSFQIHKGYGTALHYKLLKKFGISGIHRKSFLTSLTLRSV
jgi:ribonuclease HII